MPLAPCGSSVFKQQMSILVADANIRMVTSGHVPIFVRQRTAEALPQLLKLCTRHGLPLEEPMQWFFVLWSCSSFVVIGLSGGCHSKWNVRLVPSLSCVVLCQDCSTKQIRTLNHGTLHHTTSGKQRKSSLSETPKLPAERSKKICCKRWKDGDPSTRMHLTKQCLFVSYRALSAEASFFCTLRGKGNSFTTTTTIFIELHQKI